MPDFFGRYQDDEQRREVEETMNMAKDLSDWERLALMLAMQGGSTAETMDDGYDEYEEADDPSGADRFTGAEDFWL